MNKKLRTICIGDTHGCLEEFDKLTKKIGYNPSNDRMILLGDLIDRGEHSVGMVKLAREMNLESVMGNHEYKFLKWFRDTGSNVNVYHKREHYTKFSDADINYISQMPPYIKIDNTIIVHAGLRAGISLENQSKEDLYHIRYMDAQSKFINIKKVAKLGVAELGAHLWTEYWTGPESIIYGHNSNINGPIIDEIAPGVMCIGIDTGCCFGGNLTAFILETKEIIQVKAKRIYYESKF
jgi:bis(5'-nucleosyl)-tetraphosphatase (symmetrical)